MDVGGQDATEAFEDVGHSDEAREILDKLLVGNLKRVVRPHFTSKPLPTSSNPSIPTHPNYSSHSTISSTTNLSFPLFLLHPVHFYPKADFHNFFFPVTVRRPRPEIRTPQTYRGHHRARQHRLRHRHLRSRAPRRRPRLRSLQVPAIAEHGTKVKRSVCARSVGGGGGRDIPPIDFFFQRKGLLM